MSDATQTVLAIAGLATVALAARWWPWRRR